MDASNLVFHLVAAVVLLGLVLLFLSVKRAHLFLQKICVAQKDETMVQWPGVFARDFCQAMGIDFHSKTKLTEGSPRPQSPYLWLQLYRMQKIRSIVWEQHRVLITFASSPSPPVHEMIEKIARQWDRVVEIRQQ